jgi:outer membrane biosynthesis protein TonB
MGKGALLSGILHGIVFLLLLIGLPNFLKRKLEPPPVIPIEIINISDLTKAPDLKVKPKEDGPKEKLVEKSTPPKPMPVAEKTPEPEPEPEKEVEPDPTPEPDVTMDDLLDKIPEEKPKEKPKPVEKPKEKKKEKPKKKPKKDFTKLLNSIEKTESSSEGPTQPEKDESSTADHAANTIGKLSVTELDLIRRQLTACWNIPAGTRDAKELSVEIRITISPEAKVLDAKIEKTSIPLSDPRMRVIAESAKRAARNPKCSPLKLPLDRYDEWKDTVIRFSPQNL